MPARLSRRKIAQYAAEQMIAGVDTKRVIKQLAAFLVDTNRMTEYELLVRDIEAELAERGIVVADITSAYPLEAGIKSQVAKLVGARSVQLRQAVDPMVLGGIRVDIPGKRFDGTIRHKLTALKAKQL